jgi:hypothetical protein
MVCIFPAQCKEVAKDFIKDQTSVQAFTGLCYDQKVGKLAASVNCTVDDNGQLLTVEIIFNINIEKFVASLQLNI